MERFLHYFSKRYLPRWFILAIDVLIVLVSVHIAYILRFNFDFGEAKQIMNPWRMVWFLPLLLFVFVTTKPYSGILRQSTAMDVLRIIQSMFLLGVILALMSLTGRFFHFGAFFIQPLSVIVIMVPVSILLMTMTRLTAKLIFIYLGGKRQSVRVVIFGAGDLGQITRNVLMTDSSFSYNLVGFIDDNPSLQNKTIGGLPIWPAETAFNKMIPHKAVHELIFAVDPQKITRQRKREITDLCLANNMAVKEVPSVSDWINGQMKPGDIRRINIEDLLGRDSIRLDSRRIAEGLKDAEVLVTGAAGSIGSEIVRQLIAFRTKHVVLLDKAESDLFNFQQEILTKNPNAAFTPVIGDVTNLIQLRRIFETYKPAIVFNAAAYKHVPLMEDFPCEALRVNVGGTKNLADLSMEFGVEKFVFISTDKAVNPTSVMGASKRIGEIYIQSLAQAGISTTRFITTRFGNVLGSNGSVVPLFKKQIEMGGPVTVTHQDITRYFMTIPEACQLVLEAGFMGEGGEIYLFEMGEPVKIYDLAKKMIALSGYVPGQDIKIQVTGLRPGEKLYEELFDNREELLPTHNDQILIGRVRKHDRERVNHQVSQLLRNVDVKEHCTIVDEMMKLVPEFNPVNALYRHDHPVH